MSIHVWKHSILLQNKLTSRHLNCVEEENMRYENVGRGDLKRKRTWVAVPDIRKRFTGSRAT